MPNDESGNKKDESNLQASEIEEKKESQVVSLKLPEELAKEDPDAAAAYESIARNAAEIVTPELLFRMLKKYYDIRKEFQKDGRLHEVRPLKAYIGFEPSGYAHLGWLVCTNGIIALQNAGFHVDILLADWHAFINDKFKGNMEKIKTCTRYLEDCILALGCNPNQTGFIYASDYVNDSKYWELVIRSAKASSLSRIKRALTIMGRKEDEGELDASKLLYPSMQVADIFYFKVDVALGGMDQRKAHMLAMDVASKLKLKKFVPIHTPLLPSLEGYGTGRMDSADAKMSKSKPDSAVFIHDTEEQIKAKLKKAYCAPGDIENNPVLSIVKLGIWPRKGSIAVKHAYSGNSLKTYTDYAQLESDYKNGLIHPGDLKEATATALSDVLEPVREYFRNKPENYNKMKEIAK